MAQTGPTTVLIIDDDAELRYLLRRIVQRAGLTSLEAVDGQHGIELFRRHRTEIACVILDQFMPVLGGSATLRALRGLHPELPVLLISGFAYEHHEADPSDAQTIEIQKPFTITELGSALQRLIGGVAPR